MNKNNVSLNIDKKISDNSENEVQNENTATTLNADVRATTYTKTQWVDNVTIVDAAKMNKIEDALESLHTSKVERDGSKVLSENDFTTVLKQKVESIDTIQNTVTSLQNTKVDKSGNKVLSTNDFTNDHKAKVEGIGNMQTNITSLQNGKVDKESGKALSTNDFTNDYKSKVDLIKRDQGATKYLSGEGTYVDLPKQTISNIAAQGTITLETNKIYKGTLTGNVQFTLPEADTLDNTILNQIMVQLEVNDDRIDVTWGTTLCFGTEQTNLLRGKYDCVFEFNGTNWVYGIIEIRG